MERKPLSLHEKVLLAVVAVAGLITLFYMFIYQPQRDEITTLQSKVNDIKKEVAQFEDFDQTINDTNLEIDDYNQKIYDATLEWYPDIRQDDIIKDLDPKMKKTGLNDSTVTFVNTQIAQIASMFGEKEEVPTLAEALALAYVDMVQAEATPSPDGSPTTEPAKPTTAATAAPASTNGEKAEGNILATEVDDSDPKEPLVSDEVQKKFDELHASLKELSDEELQKEIQKIVDNTVANVQKLTVSVTFKNTPYQNIMDFVHKVEASSPAIYISEISFDDSTEDYISELEDKAQEELDANTATLAEGTEKVTASELFNNTYPASSLALSSLKSSDKNQSLVNYNGPTRYTGAITLTYFAISKIHNQDNAN